MSFTTRMQQTSSWLHQQLNRREHPDQSRDKFCSEIEHSNHQAKENSARSDQTPNDTRSVTESANQNERSSEIYRIWSAATCYRFASEMRNNKCVQPLSGRPTLLSHVLDALVSADPTLASVPAEKERVYRFRRSTPTFPLLTVQNEGILMVDWSPLYNIKRRTTQCCNESTHALLRTDRGADLL